MDRKLGWWTLGLLLSVIDASEIADLEGPTINADAGSDVFTSQVTTADVDQLLCADLAQVQLVSVDRLREEVALMRRRALADRRRLGVVARRCRPHRRRHRPHRGAPPVRSDEGAEPAELRSYRQDLLALRSEMEAVKEEVGGGGGGGARSANAAKTLQWLLGAVHQLQQDVTQTDRLLNAGEVLRRANDGVDRRLQQVEQQLTGLHHRLLAETARRLELAARMADVRRDVDDLGQRLGRLQLAFGSLDRQLIKTDPINAITTSLAPENQLSYASQAELRDLHEQITVLTRQVQELNVTATAQIG